MPSPFWSMTPQEGYDSAFDYESQGALLKEAEAIVSGLIVAYQTRDLRFHIDDKSPEKAIWMLHFDALDALRECICLLRENRHAVASRLFRDVVETLDLAAHFNTRSRPGLLDLAKWYRDEVIPHRRIREQVGQRSGIAAKNDKAEEYSWLSKFTHRTYRALCQGFCLGAGDKMWFDWRIRKIGSSTPQTIAQYVVTLGSLVSRFVNEAVNCSVVPTDEIRSALKATVLSEAFGKSDDGNNNASQRIAHPDGFANVEG